MRLDITIIHGYVSNYQTMVESMAFTPVQEYLPASDVRAPAATRLATQQCPLYSFG